MTEDDFAKIPIAGITPISKHFTWRDAVFLPTWNRFANDLDGLNRDVFNNLLFLFQKMDLVRDFFGKPIIVHVAYRPQAYNQLVGGAKDSAHQALWPQVAACDFHVFGIDCDAARDQILKGNLLDTWNMRMEDRPKSNWIHLDTRIPTNGKRFFKP